MARHGRRRLGATIDARGARALAATAVAAGAALVAGRLVRRRANERARERAAERYRLPPSEPAGVGLRRMARAQLKLAADALRGDGVEDLPARIHAARKALKRVRTIVRLTRDQLGPDIYRQENAAFREAGRRLSRVRDAHVMGVNLLRLCERWQDELPADAFAHLSAALRAESSRAHERATQDPALIAGVLATLEAAQTRVMDWPLGNDADAGAELRAALSGLERIYRRGRRMERRARHNPSAARLHQLRKRSKDLCYSASLLRALAPRPLGRLEKAAHELSDLLGEDHDLAVLLEHARGLTDALRPGELERLTSLVRHRRKVLQRRALKRARKIYGRKPGRFTGRLRNAINSTTSTSRRSVPS